MSVDPVLKTLVLEIRKATHVVLSSNLVSATWQLFDPGHLA